jgi:hypothetical protein
MSLGLACFSWGATSGTYLPSTTTAPHEHAPVLRDTRAVIISTRHRPDPDALAAHFLETDHLGWCCLIFRAASAQPSCLATAPGEKSSVSRHHS